MTLRPANAQTERLDDQTSILLEALSSLEAHRHGNRLMQPSAMLVQTVLSHARQFVAAAEDFLEQFRGAR